MTTAFRLLGVLAAASTFALAHAQTFYGADPSAATLTNHNAAKASFLAALGSFGTLDLESLSTGPQAGVAVAFGSRSGILTTGSGPGVAEAGVRDATSVFNTYAFSGRKYLYLQGDPGTTLVTFTLGAPVVAVGFSMSDEADYGASSTLGHDLVLGNGEVYSLTPVVPYSLPDGNAAFFGVVSATPFSSFSIRMPANAPGSGLDADAVGIDDLIVGVRPVPEPATLVGASAGLLALARRRR